MILPILYKDFYKTDHRRQYPDGTEIIYSNLTPRGSLIPGIDKVVVFGIQYFIKEYLINRFNQDFFSKPKQMVLDIYKRRMDHSLGENAFPLDHISDLHDLGYLPIRIKSLPEGSLCPLRIPFLTICNTNPKFFWLTNFLETIMCNIIWGGVNSATIAHEYKKVLSTYAKETSSCEDFVGFQGHDFSMRGMFGLEAALISGMGHLCNFMGTDTIPAIDALEMYYNADSSKELVGASVPATEHSVMCMGGDDSEIETYKRLLTKTYPKGIVSIVSDTWDYWGVLKDMLPRLKETIISRNGKLVIRPDSGDPVKIICGDGSSKGSAEVLWDIFGGFTNDKGYRELDSHIGLIYGDSITLDRCKRICEGLKEKGFASTNIVYGIGSYTYQYNTRDSLGFAMKSTYGEINGNPHNIFKKPKTDDGIKNSAKGLLRVNENYTLSEEVTWQEEKEGLLKTVFKNGRTYNQVNLSDIRKRLDASICNQEETHNEKEIGVC